MRTHFPSLVGILLVASLFAIGCSSETAVKKDGGLSEMVTQLGKIHDTIKDGIEAGDEAGNSAAHGALHEVGDVLGKLATIGTDSGLAAADRDKVKASAEVMAEIYGKIDGAQHAADFAVGSIDYSEYATPLNEALIKLKSFCN